MERLSLGKSLLPNSLRAPPEMQLRWIKAFGLTATALHFGLREVVALTTRLEIHAVAMSAKRPNRIRIEDRQ